MSPNASKLEGVISPETLRRMAGERSYKLGQEYFESDCVSALAQYQGTLTARVQGTRTYRVKLVSSGGKLDYACSCPIGQEGAFCKHCVATGLAWLKEQGGRQSGRGAKKGAAVTLEDARRWLLTQKPEALVEMIMQQALEDERLRRSLLLKAAGKSGGTRARVDTLREAIDSALDAYDDEDEDYGWDGGAGGDLDQIAGEIEQFLKEGHAAEALELAEYGLDAVERAMNSGVDDSEGYLGGVLDRLQELHLKACRKARPDPEELAERLFERALESDYDVFSGALETYKSVLGKKGAAAWRAMVQQAWDALPPRKPGENEWGETGRRYQITRMMEDLARDAGDLEALVAIKSKDLTSAWHYLEIAELYRQNRRYDQALEWAERGLAALPKPADWRLREFLADEYHRCHRHGEAMALVWAQFSENPVTERYKDLKQHAERAGEWPAWRERALAFIRDKIEKTRRAAKQKSWGGWAWEVNSDNSTLVEIFLWEGDVEAAWREAQEGGCYDQLWMALAKKREPEHPADALAVYQRRIGPILDQKNNDAYQEAVGLLKKIKELLGRTGREEEFAGYLQGIRTAHKPKRNFIKLLDAARW